eukprot:Sspe_Gene.883::Locus_298_Transcript_1_1_Confidence_1.000_Length_2914::g.883::m.883
MGEQTINNVLVRALAGKQGPATAVSEQSQAAQILCATSSQLFDGGSCDGMLNTAQGPGCPRIDPVSNVLTFRPAIHAVGDADVTCTIYETSRPGPACRHSLSNSPPSSGSPR